MTLIIDDVMLREPRLLTPRGSPVKRVGMDVSHSLSKECLFYAPLHEKTKLLNYNIVNFTKLVEVNSDSADQYIPLPFYYDGLSCVNNDKDTSQGLTYPKTLVTNACTLCCEIFKPSSFVSLQSPLFNREGEGVATGINAGAYLASTKLGIHWGGTLLYKWTGGPVLPVNEWMLVALTREFGTGNQAINAHIVSYSSGYQTSFAGVGASITFDALKIGLDSYGSARIFRGYIANARVYNRSLSKNELCELFFNPYQMLIPV